MFPLLKRGGPEKFYPCLEGGGGAQTVSDPQISHFVAPPLLVINDQFLRKHDVNLSMNVCAHTQTMHGSESGIFICI